MLLDLRKFIYLFIYVFILSIYCYLATQINKHIFLFISFKFRDFYFCIVVYDIHKAKLNYNTFATQKTTTTASHSQKKDQILKEVENIFGLEILLAKRQYNLVIRKMKPFLT